jgi:hypothetical protein
MRIKNLKLVNALFKPNDLGVSEWRKVTDITKPILISGNEYKLNWTKNGNMRKGVAFGVNKYVWETKRYNGAHKGKIVALKLNGFNPILKKITHPISKEIKKYCKNLKCVHCGKVDKGGNLPDHKNDLYNDTRVLSTKTQVLDDFQPMCNGCNLIKRSKNVKMMETKIRPTPPYDLLELGFPKYIEGDETFDLNDINTMKGTYWYDPVEFRKKCKTYLINNM